MAFYSSFKSHNMLDELGLSTVAPFASGDTVRTATDLAVRDPSGAIMAFTGSFHYENGFAQGTINTISAGDSTTDHRFLITGLALDADNYRSYVGWEQSAIVFSGHDIMSGSSQSDTMSGYGNNDYISGNGGADVLFGSWGADTIIGSTSNEVLFGGNGIVSPDDGNDSIISGGGADTVYGNGGDDTMFVSGLGYGGKGSDILFGYETNDLLYGGGSGIDPLDTADVIVGGPGSDTIFGNGGADTLFGDQDTPATGDGNDLIFGGRGNDAIITTGGNDTLYGNQEDDIFSIQITTSTTGNITIGDFVSGSDKIQIEEYPGISSYSDLSSHISGGLITLGSVHINVSGVALLSSSDFTFT